MSATGPHVLESPARIGSALLMRASGRTVAIIASLIYVHILIPRAGRGAAVDWRTIGMA
ncbi:hypothetical protein SKAU_G00123880 [Synaphobranchus kaupii]|uniref:Uncharacterized protein n=1 Tax=Synaphobranchus kaupii TaxID=118154 RepID=A0A9Q1J0J7_SYNKA|nr:hypothetical protein SKAU_G00123880 [Synaphobranchus kaupii]